MRTFRRLLGFLRPYRRSLIFSLLLAWLAMGMTVLIPLLVGDAVDAIENGHRDDILPLALALLGAGVLRLGLTVGRRLIAGKVSLDVEYDLRQSFYEHLQKLELGFFDTQQTGQLMSRATVDLQSIRFFLGYGLIWVSQSALTILFAAAVMIVLDPLLALLALAPVPFLIATATRYSRRNRPAEQEVQQRVGELTAGAEESVSGIRIVKAFARERHMLARFRRVVDRVFEQSMVSTRLQAFYTPLMGFLPNIGLAVVLLVGGNQVINGSLSVGDFTAFFLYVRAALGPGALARDVAEHGPAGGRLGQPHVRDPRPRAVDDQPARRAGAAPRRRPGLGRGRDAALRRRRAVADGHRPRGRARPHGGAGRAHRLGQDQPGRTARAAL